MKRIAFLIIIISSAFAASQAILDIISNPNWTHDPNNLDLVVNEKLLGQNDEGSPDEIRSDVLNAKFKALHLKIKKLSCEKEGNVYNLETETCNPPVQLLIERNYSIVDGSPVAGIANRVFNPNTINKYCPLGPVSPLGVNDLIYSVAYTSISLYNTAEEKEAECIAYEGIWNSGSCDLSESQCLSIGSVYNRNSNVCEIMNFNPVNTSIINTNFYNVSQTAIESFSNGQEYSVWEYEDGTPYENNQPESCVFN